MTVVITTLWTSEMSVFYMSAYRTLAIFSESDIIIMLHLSFVVFIIKLSAFTFFLIC